MLGLVFYVISIVCLRRALDKFHNAKFFAHGKPILIEKSKAEEIFFGKKKKKKKKSSTLASIFRTKKSSSKQNLPYIMLKTRSPFIYASTSLIQIVILKGVCRSVVLLLSTFSSFFHFSLFFPEGHPRRWEVTLTTQWIKPNYLAILPH